MNGIILLDKPEGKSSHDMVNFVRRLVGIRKVGHTGTLDPIATGVLPICVGNATKAADMLTAEDKRYEAVIALGKRTDTFDRTGTVLEERPVNCTENDIRKAIDSFIGESEQLPPMYSAVKINGKKLYELAREGVEIERKARKICISRIDILEVDIKKCCLCIDVECSKGTYIRTLCDDIGQRLGTGAYMMELRRTRSGKFEISSCNTPERLEALKSEGRLAEAVIPTDHIFAEFAAVKVGGRRQERVLNGAPVRYSGHEGALYRVYDEEGQFLCLSRCVAGELRMEKAFWPRKGN